ncbi:short chain dehydrogenase family protein [Yamadazyma tenuis]|uniref:NAD(P)-binding protein n=1 Tax=Candida tenuis (strain ATCC 10573 / BCRC 21748 / CBS 615 / JCM 9827 / NBRC 10315 / NRRL Y-1498 / VKM Y-70) TaxID=590646 RepID=G3BET9_CANTC|nr:NAD(P)-binding protein [Yamadazyma tenuis ATCC 10573]XP_006690424.1 uncharacterized protein CANTEDRAFT_116668 [Yamadazyma tenuis ATCC 10573]EGV61209.1 NAD(P)-binding protein [Yamadazyma tenuis ATCC 10573]EGV61210.1 hypothetical protein CANTEDRAFT_116668 [Yamadazyma tenuis ATCC 10573]WEJ94161.1 short chain dehydrogenase family protein [Yamadazyma tenuis]
MSEQQKYALVTGASSGIGYAMAKVLSKKGYKVFGCSPKSDSFKMKPLADEFGVVPFDCDISKLEDIKALSKSVGKLTGGRLDILYNNGGIATGGAGIEMDEEEVNKVFQINVIGHINMTKHFVDYVIETQGAVVFTSSVASIIPLSWTSIYCATKAAINSYARVLHAELKPFDVKVYSVITGGVDTPIADHFDLTQVENSRYNVEGGYESVVKAKGMSRNKWTTEDPEVYAEGVARKVIGRSNSFNLYKGGMAYTLYLLTIWAPLWLMQWFISFHFKQNKVFRNLKKANKEKIKRKLTSKKTA